MNFAKYFLGIAVTAVFLSNVAAAADGITLPFFAKGNVVSQVQNPDGTLQIEALGQATHLGQYTAYVTLMIFPGEPPTFAGVITMVASNGDELYLINFGIVTEGPPVPGGDGGYEIVGGTGRFTNAVGEGGFSSHVGETRFWGTITLPNRN